MENKTKQECIPVGCVPSASVAILGGGEGCLSGGCLPRGVRPGSVYPGWCLPRGLSVQGDVCPRGCLSRGVSTPPPLTEFLTHACENITFPQLLFTDGHEKITEHQLGPIYQFGPIDTPHINLSMHQSCSILPTFLFDLTFPSPWFRCPYLS